MTRNNKAMRLPISGIEINIDNFTDEDYTIVRETLRNSLSQKSHKNRDAIKNAFAEAVRRAPMANPSDLWHHIVYRSYIEIIGCLRPVSDVGQSWKRASGEAFELFITEYYNPLVKSSEVMLRPLIGKESQMQALSSLGILGQVGNSKLGSVYIFLVVISKAAK